MSSRVYLTAREGETLGLALQSVTDENQKDLLRASLQFIKVDYDKLSTLGRFANAGTAQASYEHVITKLLTSLASAPEASGDTNHRSLGRLVRSTEASGDTNHRSLGRLVRSTEADEDIGDEVTEAKGDTDDDLDTHRPARGVRRPRRSTPGIPVSRKPASRKRKLTADSDEERSPAPAPAKRNHKRASTGINTPLATQLPATAAGSRTRGIGASAISPLRSDMARLDRVFAPIWGGSAPQAYLGAEEFRFAYDPEDEAPRGFYPRLSGFVATEEEPLYKGQLPSLEPGPPIPGQAPMKNGKVAFSSANPDSQGGRLSTFSSSSFSPFLSLFGAFFPSPISTSTSTSTNSSTSSFPRPRPITRAWKALTIGSEIVFATRPPIRHRGWPSQRYGA